ncbi:MAG: hypothetical protein OHK0045_20420 [Raineya sp.]
MEEAIKQTKEDSTESFAPSFSPTIHSEELKQAVSFSESQQNEAILDLFEEALEKGETYQSGFWNGYFELSKDSAEGYLSTQTMLKNYKEELQVQEQMLKEIEQSIENNDRQYGDLFSQLTQINHQLDYQINLKKRREHELAETNKQIERYRKENEELRNKNSFLGGLLFLVAAIIFILGDLIISHEIVAYALNIKNSVEAWSFAVGLAMVSVLLKPAYDRLIEYPYSQDKTLRSKRVYLIFKILIVIFTILTLCILGYFRYEAYRADQLKSNINSNILALQEDESGEALKLIEKLSLKSENLSQDLVNSSSGMWAFVLSGVMFAIAGAICLGIAFPILVAYVRIWFQIPMKIKRLEKTRIEQNKTIEEIELLLSQQLATAEAKKNLISTLGVLEDLKSQRAEMQKRILSLKKRINETETEMQIYELTIGYEKGQKQKHLEKEKQEMQKMETAFVEKQAEEALINKQNNGQKKIEITSPIKIDEMETVRNEKQTEKSNETPLDVIEENKPQEQQEESLKQKIKNEQVENEKSLTIPDKIRSKIKKK